MVHRQRIELHRVEQHRSAMAGVDAIALVSNRTFPRHCHDQFGFGVMLTGGHRSWSGMGMVEATPGDVICVNPGEVHDGTSMGDDVRGWLMLYVDARVLDEHIGADIKSRSEIVSPVIKDATLASRITSCFNCIADLPLDLLACEERLIACVACLFGKYGVHGLAIATFSPPVSRALEYLHEQAMEPVSLGELAALSGTSRFRFLRAFTRELGITPHAYQMQLRVQLSQRLLKSGQTIAEAAVNAGFADQSHLTRCFVRQLGITPARYKRAVG
jgi:AraC-like DNA-binding protein